MAILLALGAAVGYGSADFLGGLASRKTSANIVVVLSQLAGLGLLLALLPFVDGEFYPADLGWGIFGGFCSGFGFATMFAAFKVGRMDIISPINAVVCASVPVIFGLAAGEKPSIVVLFGASLAPFAIALVSTNAETGRFSLREPGIGLAMISGVLFGSVLVAMSRAHKESGVWMIIMMRVTSITMVGACCLVRRESLRDARPVLPVILLAGYIDIGANLLYLFATRHDFVAIVGVITCLYPAATVFLAQVVLGDA